MLSDRFGYVDFADAETAKKAVEQMTGATIDGREVRCDLSTPRPPKEEGAKRQFNDQIGEPSTTLFVGNLSFEATEDSVWEAFANYGGVSSVRLPTDRETGNPKGFGYVEFSDLESAKKAVEAGTGGASLEIDGRAVRLDYSQPRDASAPRGGGRG